MNGFVVVTLIWLLTCLSGCGGGGGGSGTPDPNYSSVTVVLTTQSPRDVPLKDARVTFPQGSLPTSTSITISESRPPKFPQPGYIITNPALTISLSQRPSKDLLVSYPITSGAMPVFTVVKNDQVISGLHYVIGQGRAFATVPRDLFVDESRSPLARFNASIVLGVAKPFNPPDSQYGLILMEGKIGSGSSAIIVHGLLQSVDAMVDSAKALKELGGYEAVYTFGYDYRKPIYEVGGKLAQAIKQKNFPEKSVDVIGYSKGGLVTLHAVGQTTQTKPIRRVILLATPIRGCTSTLHDLYVMLTVQFVQRSALSVMITPEDDCLGELMPNSPTIASLTASREGQRGDIDFWLFAGGNDLIVGESSALDRAYQVENISLGRVMRSHLIGESHSAMSERRALKEAYEIIRTTQTTGLSVITDPTRIEVSTETGYWSYEIVFRNTTKETMTIYTATLEAFNRKGEWINTSWLPPINSQGDFPTKYTECRITLNPGATYRYDLNSYGRKVGEPYWDLPEENRARGNRLITTAVSKSGNLYKNHLIFNLNNGSYSITIPNTRSSYQISGREPSDRTR